MTIDFKTFKAGDIVGVKLDGRDVLNINSDRVGYWRYSQIETHTPAPFDWDTIKAGMAFEWGNDGNVYRYVGVSMSGQVVLQMGSYNEYRVFEYGTKYLTRMPESDLTPKETQ